MWGIISGKDINSHVHIISFISTIFLFSGIFIYKYKKGILHKFRYKALIGFWLTTIAVMTCGVILHQLIWIILQHGISALTFKHLNDFIGLLITTLMTFSFPGMVMVLLTINHLEYINNFSKILIVGLGLIFIPDVMYFITTARVIQTNEVFYGVFSDLVGIVLLGFLLSLIITKFNITIFKKEKKGRLQIEYYFIVSIVFTLVLSTLVYLFFLTQLPSNVTIKLTDWKAISLRTTENGLNYEVIKPKDTTILPRYQGEGSVFLTGPVGSMQINSVNYGLDPDDTILIIQASSINIDNNIEGKLVINAVSRVIILQNKALPLTMWSTVSPSQKTVIIAGMFTIISALIIAATSVYIKFKIEVL